MERTQRIKVDLTEVHGAAIPKMLARLCGSAEVAEFPNLDSTITKISEVVPKTAKRFYFLCEYDFGDGWQHEVLFEGCLPAAPGTTDLQVLKAA